MRHYTIIVFLGGVLIFLMNSECEHALARGGRGGGGGGGRYGGGGGSRTPSRSGGSSRYSDSRTPSRTGSSSRYSDSRTSYRSGGGRYGTTRGVGSRSSVTRAFRSSRASIASRYSYSWKVRAHGRGYIYIHPSHRHSSYYTSESTINDWKVCFNVIFSGDNNSPIIPIYTHEQMRTLDDSVYEMAVNRLVNVTLKHGMVNPGDVEFANENELDESNSWQYVGLFACPMFVTTSTEKQETDCCGPEDAEYCCVPDSQAYIGVLVAIIIGLLILSIFIICKRKAIMGCFGHHKHPRMSPVDLTPEDEKVGDGTQPELVPLNSYPYNEGGTVILAPLPPIDQPVATGMMGPPGGPAIGFDGYSGNQNGAPPPGNYYYPPAPQPDGAPPPMGGYYPYGPGPQPGMPPMAPPTYEAANPPNPYWQPTV